MTSRLAVRLSNPVRDVHVTRQVADVTWREAIPGGFESATIQLARPLNVTPAELQYYSKLFVYDTRNGATLFEGRVEDLGRGSDANGQIWTVNAVGGAAHAQDTTTVLMYQDVDLGNWVPAPDAAQWINTGQITTSAYGPGLTVGVNPTAVIAAGRYYGLQYRVMDDNNLNVAVVAARHGEDTTDTSWSWEIDFQALSGGALTTGASATFVAGSSANTAAVIATNFPTGSQLVTLALLRGSGSPITVSDNNTTVTFVTVLVRSTLFTQAGTEQLTAATYNGVPLKASLVVADLLGRLLPKFGGAAAQISTASDYTFAEALTYPGGTTAAQVLSDLMLLLPNMFWAAWESDPGTGLYRFEWSPWPTTVRYDATARDGFASPGSAADLYDTVVVTWTDAAGNPKTTTSTLPNPILNAAGFHRTARIALASGLSGVTAATQAGQQFLAQHAVPPNAGTLNVARPIYDRVLARMVQPWEIRPGSLIQVRDVAPTTNLTGGRDGVSVFRVVAKTFTSADTTAVLELDAPANTLIAQTASLLYA